MLLWLHLRLAAGNSLWIVVQASRDRRNNPFLSTGWKVLQSSWTLRFNLSRDWSSFLCLFLTLNALSKLGWILRTDSYIVLPRVLQIKHLLKLWRQVWIRGPEDETSREISPCTLLNIMLWYHVVDDLLLLLVLSLRRVHLVLSDNWSLTCLGPHFRIHMRRFNVGVMPMPVWLIVVPPFLNDCFQVVLGLVHRDLEEISPVTDCERLRTFGLLLLSHIWNAGFALLFSFLSEQDELVVHFKHW